jgi:hypothetical protein
VRGEETAVVFGDEVGGRVEHECAFGCPSFSELADYALSFP